MFTTNTREVTNFFGTSLHPDRQFLYPERHNAERAAVNQFTKLKQQGIETTLVDGAFDVPHANHEGYLRHCRLIGAEALLLASGQLLTDEARRAAVLSNDMHLTVTVDADEKIHAKKSGLAGKGGVQRPIYPWQSRAERIAGYVFELGNKLRRTVDLVTVEGDMSEHSGTPFESSLELAAYLKRRQLLDNFIIFGEHDTTVNEAERAGLEPIVIPHHEGYFINPQTDDWYSSSALICRAQGGAVAHSITKPIQRGSDA